MGNRIDANTIFELGNSLGRLETDLDLENTPCSIVREDIQTLCKYRDTESLELIGTEALRDLSWISRKYKDRNKPLEEDDSNYLSSLIQNWYGRIDEISKTWVICLPQTKLDVTKLTSGAEPFFDEEEWNVLNDLEKQGLNEAATSLLGNNFTASEFMSLRTVESVLRRWYERKTSNAIGNVTWGKVLNKLEKEFPERKRPTEISALFHLRRRRNAIAHPDVISNETDANVTFIYVVNGCKAVKDLLLTSK